MLADRDLPSGTVTLLFTDIEGSTVLAERLGERWPAVLAEHNRILREAFTAHGGVEVDHEGDALFVAFSGATAAASAAAAAQNALAVHEWPQGARIRVRMGLHTGEPTHTPDGYVGIDVHRAARVAAAAHGGQVLLSQTTRDLLPESVGVLTFRDLGEHRLKDLSRPQRLHQLCGPELPSAFPPLRTIGVPTNLPAQPTPFLGRERELEAIGELLLAAGTRMLTLTGAGGSGKTRLGLQAAADLVDAFPHGVYGVFLADVGDPEMVPLELARVLGIEESAALPVIEALKKELANRRTLLVFDNFEHVRGAAPFVTDLLAACAGLRALVTSREPLHVAAEHQYPVPPLADSEAVLLFVERARAVRPDFELDDETRPIVGEICARLDALPLAIELAAAWSKVLSPSALQRRLERRLELPAARGADLHARQSTLRQAIAWSYDLLAEEERRLHALLSVFVGGCTVASAHRVAALDADVDLEVLELLAALVDRSLLREGEDSEGEPRFTMLETIREYAREQLAATGEEEVVARRHALEFARFAEEADASLHGGDQLLWLDRLEGEHDNLRAALDWALDAGDGETALRLGGALGWFWYAHGHALEGCSRLTDLLARTKSAPEELRARSMYALGVLLDQRGEPERAAELVEQSLGVFRAQGDSHRVARALNSLGTIKRSSGDLDAARSLLVESIQVRRHLADEAGTASALSNLGVVAFERGDLDEAEKRFQEALELDRRHGNEWGTAVGLDNLAAVALEAGDLGRAGELVSETLMLAERFGDRELIAFGLEKAAVLAALEERPARAGRLLGAADALRRVAGIERIPFDADWLGRHVGAVAGEEFEAARTDGQMLDVGDALREARGA